MKTFVLWDQGEVRDYEIKGKWGIMRSRGTKGLWDKGEIRDYEIKGKWGFMRSRGTKGL